MKNNGGKFIDDHRELLVVMLSEWKVGMGEFWPPLMHICSGSVNEIYV